MKQVKKYTTFESLKFTENKQVVSSSSLKKHDDFKKMLLEIVDIKKKQSPKQSKP